MLRWGTDLAANFGSAQIDSETPFRAGMIGASRSAWFVFAGLEARYRFNDLTIEGDRPLDGLPLQPSAYQVTLEPLQATAVLGVVWYGPHVGASFTLTTSNAEYKESKHRTHGTGALSLFAFF
ncbi:exonuclease [Vibrio metschnikovii]|nr:exonuclease [Vibrio metschnikovii]